MNRWLPIVAAALAFAASVSLAVSLASFWMAASAPAEANGASTILYQETQGRYRLVVGIIPSRPVIPQTHLSMQVFDAADERLLRDTDVGMFVSAAGPPGSPGFGPQQVLNDVSLAYFEVDVPFDTVGTWEVSVSVDSGRGSEVFLIPVEVGEPGANIQWIWVSAVLVVIVLVGIWTWLKLSRRPAAQ